MSHRENIFRRRSFIGSVEPLDQRVLLTMGPVATVAPAAAAVQTIPTVATVSPIFTLAYEAAVARVDAEFIGQAQALDNLLIARIEQYEAVFAHGVTAGAARVQHVHTHGSRIRIARHAGLSPLFNAQFASQEAFFNAKAVRLSLAFQGQLATLADQFGQVSALFAIPASAFSSNVQAAATAFSSEVSSALSSVATSFQTGTAALTGSTAGGLGLGVAPSGQVFTSAFTQALNSVSANIQSVSAGLQQNFDSLQTQFATNVASLTSSFGATPFGLFSALPNYTFPTGAFPGSVAGGTSLTSGGSGTGVLTGTLGGSPAGPGTAGGNTGANSGARRIKEDRHGSVAWLPGMNEAARGRRPVRGRRGGAHQFPRARNLR